MKLLILFALAVALQAQNVRVAWVHAITPPVAGVTTTYAVERATAPSVTTQCSTLTATAWTRLAAGLAAKTYDDTVPLGSTVCYRVIATASGAGYTTTSGTPGYMSTATFLDLTPGLVGSPSGITATLIGQTAKILLDVDGKTVAEMKFPLLVPKPVEEVKP